MIFLVVTGFMVLMALRLPWRSMTRPTVAWALAAIVNTALVIVPTTFATAALHLRPEQVTNVGYFGSIVLTLVGLGLWWHADVSERAMGRWLPPLIIAVLPFALWSAIGLLYVISSRS